MPFWSRLFGRHDRTPKQSTFPVTAEIIDGPGAFEVEAVGESNYQDALWRAVRSEQPTERGYRLLTTAVLLPEPSNLYDENAVQVLIHGELGGYLSREDAVGYGPLVASHTHGPRVAACNALILGGFLQGGRRASLGIWLDLPEPGETATPRASVPRTTGSSAAALQVEAPEHGLYKGKHYTEYVEDVKTLKRHDALEALELLGALLGAVEEEAAAEGVGVAPWYYEQAAIVYRKKRDFASEVAVLERFAAQKHAPGTAPPELLARLEKARERLAREGQSKPT